MQLEQLQALREFVRDNPDEWDLVRMYFREREGTLIESLIRGASVEGDEDRGKILMCRHIINLKESLDNQLKGAQSQPVE